jgi:hypothetical protein
MRLSTILKRPLASNILNCGNIKNEPITGGISSQLQVIQCNKINKRTSLLNSSSIRQLSSSGGTINTSDSSFGENSPHNSSEKPTKINLSKSPYTPVNLAYISYEKKLKDKVRNCDKINMYTGGGGRAIHIKFTKFLVLDLIY